MLPPRFARAPGRFVLQGRRLTDSVPRTDALRPVAAGWRMGLVTCLSNLVSAGTKHDYDACARVFATK